MENENKITFWRYEVHVAGIKNRARKPNWHSSDWKNIIVHGEPNEQDARKLAMDWIKRNMRSGTIQKAYASARKWETDGQIESTRFSFGTEHSWERRYDFTREEIEQCNQ